MASDQHRGALVALNVTRTRVTVLAFNLTIISVMLSIKVAGGELGHHDILAHLSSTAALFVGFCLTLLGLWWLLLSQNLDAEGLSQPWPFTLGAITVYLALSQTVTAFMHEYLVTVKTGIETVLPGAIKELQPLARYADLGDSALLVLLGIGGATWVLMTYVAPLVTVLRGPVRGKGRWLIAGYYVALQAPIHWVYANASYLAIGPSGHSESMPMLFALQYMQPVLWFR
jgi:hypothetical protein